MGYHYRARYEFILFFEKGKRRLKDLGVADVLAVPRIHRGHPAEKPAALSEILISQSSEPGEIVGDPFMGSGSVGVAAVRAGRRFPGTDLNPEAVRLTADRLREFGAGKGFSEGVLHMLKASLHAAYCLPLNGQQESSVDTRELDHRLSAHFRWWDVLVGGKKPVI